MSTQLQRSQYEAEERGAPAIMYLQALAGINEPRERALAGWKAMSEQERSNTLAAFETNTYAPIVKVPDGVWTWNMAEPAYKHGKATWFEVSEAFWWEMLEVLPPLHYRGGFAVSEPYDHDAKDVPSYMCLVSCKGRRFFARVMRIDQAPEETLALRRYLQTD